MLQEELLTKQGLLS